MTLVTARAGEAHLARSVFALALAVRPLAAASPDCPVITNPFNALSEAQREAARQDEMTELKKRMALQDEYIKLLTGSISGMQ